MSDAPARRTGRPTLDEAAALQQTILDEALRMVGSVGTEGFSVDQLAMQIGVTKRTIYRHYKNKPGLIIAVVSREIDRLLGVLDQSNKSKADNSANPIGQLHTWIKRFFDYMRTPQTIAFQNFLMFESATSAEISAQFIKWHGYVLDHCCILISNAQDCGLIRNGCARRFSLLLLDLIAGIQSRVKPDFTDEDIFGGDDPEQYFDFRWMGFLSLVSEHPWANFISLARNEV